MRRRNPPTCVVILRRWLPAVTIKYKNVSTRKSYFISKKQRREEKYYARMADPWTRINRFSGETPFWTAEKFFRRWNIRPNTIRSFIFSLCATRGRKEENEKHPGKYPTKYSDIRETHDDKCFCVRPKRLIRTSALSIVKTVLSGAISLTSNWTSK